MVSELGLAKALRQLAGGFGRRTGLNIAMQADDVPAAFAGGGGGGLSVGAGSAVQRPPARPRDGRRGRTLPAPSILHVAVADNGIGMPPKVRRGVGLSSMRDRIEELGGRLMIRAGNPGTVLIASMPTHAEIRPVGDLAPAA